MWKLLNHKNEIFIVVNMEVNNMQNQPENIVLPVEVCSYNTVSAVCINQSNIGDMQNLVTRCIHMPDIDGYNSTNVPLKGKMNPFEKYNVIDAINELLTMGYLTLTDMTI